MCLFNSSILLILFIIIVPGPKVGSVPTNSMIKNSKKAAWAIRINRTLVLKKSRDKNKIKSRRPNKMQTF